MAWSYRLHREPSLSKIYPIVVELCEYNIPLAVVMGWPISRWWPTTRSETLVEAQNMEEMWILFTLLAAYVSKFGALAPAHLGIFFCTRMST